LLVKAYLPYRVNFGLEVVEADRPRRILSRLSKDCPVSHTGVAAPLPV
jgi:hypothetical protein